MNGIQEKYLQKMWNGAKAGGKGGRYSLSDMKLIKNSGKNPHFGTLHALNMREHLVMARNFPSVDDFFFHPKIFPQNYDE